MQQKIKLPGVFVKKTDDDLKRTRIKAKSVETIENILNASFIPDVKYLNRLRINFTPTKDTPTKEELAAWGIKESHPHCTSYMYVGYYIRKQDWCESCLGPAPHGRTRVCKKCNRVTACTRGFKGVNILCTICRKHNFAQRKMMEVLISDLANVVAKYIK